MQRGFPPQSGQEACAKGIRAAPVNPGVVRLRYCIACNVASPQSGQEACIKEALAWIKANLAAFRLRLAPASNACCTSGSAAQPHPPHLAFPHNFWIEEKATGATPQNCLLHFVEAFLGARLSYTSRGTEPAEAKRVSSSRLRDGETKHRELKFA